MKNSIRFLFFLSFIFFLSCAKKQDGTAGHNNETDQLLYRGGALDLPDSLYKQLPSVSVQRMRNARVTTLPSNLDLSPNLPPVGDQKSSNSCVAWVTAYGANSYLQKAKAGAGYNYLLNNVVDPAQVMSPAYVYNQICGGVDGGSYYTDAFEVMMTQGASTMQYMPYVYTDFITQPSAAARANALNYKITSFETVNPDVNSIKLLLANQLPVIVSVYYQNKLTSPEKNVQNEYVWKIDDGIRNQGGHALLLVGYDDSRRAFKAQNSWGTGWGNNGYIWYDYDMITKAVTKGLYVMYAPKTKFTSALQVSNISVQSGTNPAWVNKDSALVYNGCPLAVTATVKNTSATTFNGVLRFGMKSQPRQYGQVQYWYGYGAYSDNVVTMAPGESKSVTLNTTGNFDEGYWNLRVEASVPDEVTGYFVLGTTGSIKNPVSMRVTSVSCAPSTAPSILLNGNLAFGNVAIGGTGMATFSIKNTGNTAMTVNSITLPSAQFTANWTSGTIAAGATQNVTVSFKPTVATNYAGNIIVNSNATSGTNTIAVSGTGMVASAPVVSLSGNLAFGNVTIGGATTGTLAIKNTGNAAMTVSSVTLPSTQFTANWASGTIAAGATQNVTVTFKPTAATNYTGNITVNSNAASGTNTIAVSGAGVVPTAPVIALSGNLALGNVALGRAGTATLSIKNTGNAAMTVSSIEMPFPDNYKANWTSGTIAAGATQNVTISFNPTDLVNYTGNITVKSNATSGTNTITISGVGVAPSAPVIALSGNLAFGNVAVGSTATATLSIKNTGTAAMTVHNVLMPSAEFTANWTSGTIAVGATQNVTISFKPTAAVTYTGNITIGNNAMSGSSLIATSGTGVVNTAPAIQVTGDMAWGTVIIGNGAPGRTLSIKNTGNAPLVVSSLTMPSAEFWPGWTGGTIQPGQSITPLVYFGPKTAGNYTGKIIVNSNATSGTNTIAVSGTGVMPTTSAISLSGNLAFGNVTVGGTGIATLSIKNTGTAPMVVSNIVLPSAQFTTNWASGTIAAGATQNVTVNFKPTAAVNYTGNLTVTSNAASGTNTIAMSGTGSTAGPVIQVTGDLAWGNAMLGNGVPGRYITIKNTGNAPLIVYSISTPSAEFWPGWNGGTIQPNQSITTLIYFGPKEEKLYTGSVVINSNAITGTKSVTASGTGVPGVALNGTSSTLLFENTAIGAFGGPKLIYIKNIGTSPTNIVSVTMPDGFAHQGWSGGTIAAGASSGFHVNFSPKEKKTYSGDVIIKTTVGTLKVRLTGTGI